MLAALKDARLTGGHMDTFAFFFMANFLSIALLIGKTSQRAALCPGLVFCVRLVACSCGQQPVDFEQTGMEGVAIPSWAHHQQIRMETTRAFVATDDEKVFANHAASDLAWFYSPELLFLLRSKDVRPIIPACVREPLKMMTKYVTPSAFTTNGCPQARSEALGEDFLGSWTDEGAVNRGSFESAPMRSKPPLSGDFHRRGLGKRPGTGA